MKNISYLMLSLLIAIVTSCKVEEVTYHTAAKADFMIGEDTYELGQSSVFIDKSVPAAGNTIVSWLWEFGDAMKTTSAEQNPAFTYQIGGTFTVQLTVIDSNGLKATAKKDLTVFDPTKSINVVWQKRLGGTIENTVSPALSPDGKIVYMVANQTTTGAFDVKLRAYDAINGNQKWAFDITGSMNTLNPGGGASIVYSSPAVGANGDVYLAVRDLKPATTDHPRALFLLAVGGDGRLKWAYKSVDANLYAITPAIDADGRIYFGHRGKKIIVLSSAGDVLKELSLEVEVLSGMSLSKEGTLYFGSGKSSGYWGYDMTAGTQLFSYNKDFGNSTLKGSSFSVDTDGTIYAVAELLNGGAVLALRKEGVEKWMYSTPGAIANGGVSIGADGTLYANGGVAVDGKTSAGVIALKPDGTLKWHFGTKEDVNNCVPVVDNRGYIHFVSDKAVYYILRPDGTLLASAILGVKTFSSPVMDAKGYLYVGIETVAGASEIFCINSGAKSFANSAWPMKGQNPRRTGLQR